MQIDCILFYMTMIQSFRIIARANLNQEGGYQLLLIIRMFAKNPIFVMAVSFLRTFYTRFLHENSREFPID